MINITENEKRDIQKYLDANKELPDKYRFLLFESNRDIELLWNGKTDEVETLVLPFQAIEHIDEPRSEEKITKQDSKKWSESSESMLRSVIGLGIEQRKNIRGGFEDLSTGKTDIKLRNNKDHNDIFIGECLLWRGMNDKKNGYKAKIDQLLSNLQPKDKCGCLVTFNTKTKDITKCLDEVSDYLKSTEICFEEYTISPAINALHMKATHGTRTNGDKIIKKTIYHLFFQIKK